eukprot:546546-Pyramimonas_sp.AAC.1
MRLNHVSFTGTEGGADLAGAPALLSASATNGIGTSIAGVPANVVASVTSPALAGDASGPTGVVIETAAVPVILAVTRLSSSRGSLSSFAPRSIPSWRLNEPAAMRPTPLHIAQRASLAEPSMFPANCLPT